MHLEKVLIDSDPSEDAISLLTACAGGIEGRIELRPGGTQHLGRAECNELKVRNSKVSGKHLQFCREPRGPKMVGVGQCRARLEAGKRRTVSF